ncbi:MAG TPA: hypothetical protein VFF52_24970, partial [Isosphaeraceae bacterium]|nr:hypothetical protein [Isosphaeraceae bacterium]
THPLQTRRRRWVEEADSLLREAVADGFKDRVRRRSEPTFASIHSDPGFQAILFGLEFPANPFAP